MAKLEEVGFAIAEKKGKWVPHVLNEYTTWGSDCSECGEWYVVERRILGERYHYCPNCGAKMMEERNE